MIRLPRRRANPAPQANADVEPEGYYDLPPRPSVERPTFAAWLRLQGFDDVPETGGYEDVRRHTADPRVLARFDELRAAYLASVGLGRGVGA